MDRTGMERYKTSISQSTGGAAGESGSNAESAVPKNQISLQTGSPGPSSAVIRARVQRKTKLWIASRNIMKRSLESWQLWELQGIMYLRSKHSNPQLITTQQTALGGGLGNKGISLHSLAQTWP